MVDLILLGVLLLALLWGWFKGGIRVAAGLGGLIVGFQVARYYSVYWAAPVVEMLPESSGQSGLLGLISMFMDADVLATFLVQVVLFIIIFVLTRWLINKLASLLTSMFGGSILNVFNRICGALLGGAILAVAIIFIYKDVLTAIGELGFDIAFTAQEFLEHSQLILPLLYIVPRMLGL
jgi:uncharacterized membrane protein required for colicin V production